jgi:serine/threonine protein kinase
VSSNPPTTLGKYQIIREIARSNDVVYEAYDPLMNRRVAVKELAVPGGSTQQQIDDRIKRFLREARAAGSLQHPNIMTVFEVGEEGGRYFIAMEYLDGKTLRNEIDAKGFLSPDKAVEIATGVLEGLAYAHSKGVIHRDIKPDNIQLTSNGGIKITDFGIARLTFEPNLTQDGQVFGTPSYMSPEQVVGRDIDARSDLFSVGTVLYEMLAGTKPFSGDSVVTITYAIMNKQPDRPQQCNYAMWQVIERALDKSPQLRFRDASEFIQALDGAARASSSVVIDPQPQVTGQQFYAPPYGAPNPYQPYPNNAPPVVQQPIQNPYAQPTTPYGTPNPYVQPPIQQNPYGQTTPYGGYSQPYQPSGQYGNPAPYNPSAGPPQGYPAGPVPVYYPPPPRAPLLSREAKRVLGQILGVVVGLSLLCALVVMVITVASKNPNVKLPKIAGGADKSSGGETTSAPNLASSDDAALQQAAAHNEGAKAAIQSSDWDLAYTEAFEATRLAPNDTAYWENLAIATYNRAKRNGNAVQAAEWKRDAAAAYKNAFLTSNDGGRKRKMADNSVKFYLEAAEDLVRRGNEREARQVLYDAREPARFVDREFEIAMMLQFLSIGE